MKREIVKSENGSTRFDRVVLFEQEADESKTFSSYGDEVAESSVNGLLKKMEEKERVRKR